MELIKLDRDFTVCKVTSVHDVDFSNEFTFLSKTDDEISLVCESKYVPEHVTDAEHNWKGLKIAGMLDFGMVGVISKIAGLLARQEISIFVVSTYNTDYIFLKAAQYERAVKLLLQEHYIIR